MTTNEACDMVIDILRLTNDGDDMTPYDLKITECAVNGLLTPEGEEYFKALHERVKAGQYERKVRHNDGADAI